MTTHGAVPDVGARSHRGALRRWLACRRPAPDAPVRLVCLPYAGAGSSAYAGWSEPLAGHAEVWTAVLPGREGRYGEPAIEVMADLVDPLTEAVATLPGPVVLLGTSMGALIALQVAHRLTVSGTPPAGLVVLASAAPLCGYRVFGEVTRDDATLRRWLVTSGGVPDQISQDAELLDLVLPVLRSDLMLCAAYRHDPAVVVRCPVRGYAGAQDPLTPPADMAAWSDVTQGSFRLVTLPGGHFFLHEQQDVVLAHLRDDLTGMTHG